ncbi:alpha/beta fold hydrolase [Tsuneonella flava]|uniref:Alpha/beta fold hydrolase n=1 Tax=Tsuneonella flava TaxID=2055955 RepID=A0ABX7KBR0_9SPHN|nr:alpha/beta fold hydrolase [Tsuneonella flava]QSB45705.1 alpha/beta fold hydrolase [Tsuneonella flava]
MAQITANDITIEYEDYGDPGDPAILLVMGLGAQLTLWPIELVDALVERGFRVIRYDNRDIGLSQKMDGEEAPGIFKLVLMNRLGLKPRVPYTLSDMAADGVGLLEALNIDNAHIVGASMGGMIAQLIAAEHPKRTASLTSIMSTTGNRKLPAAQKEAIKVLTTRPPSADEEVLVAHGIRVARTIGSPAYPPSEDRLLSRVREGVRRSYYPDGLPRQLAAILADGDRRKRLAAISAPTLVIHGEADPLVPLAGGLDTAESIPGARISTFPGMGHDLPLALVEPIADLIAEHAGKA